MNRFGNTRAARRGRSAAVWISLMGGALLVAAGSVGAETVDAAKVEAGKADFLVIAQVLQSPRCKNCHPAGDAPLNGDKGVPHAMNVSRRSPDAGLKCTSCHRETAVQQPSAPPVAPNWHMPSADMPMVFEGRTPAALCKQLKDPAQNGGKTVADLEEHMGHDKLVLWGWKPGPGRSTPPVTHEELMKRVRGWIAAGAPCPP